MKDFNIIVTILLVLIVIISIWAIKKYFSINIRDSKKSLNFNNTKTTQTNKQSKNYYIDENNKHIAGNSTITESNSTLSYKNFDGVNENPRVKSSDKINIKDLDKEANNKISYDLANESIAHQPPNKDPTNK